MDVSATVNYKLEAVKKHAGETDLESIRRVVTEHAKDGWRVVEASGDENLLPSLIFEKADDVASKEILVQEIPKVQGSDEITQLKEKLAELNNEGWIPLTVLDSIFTSPIGIFEKTDRKPADPDLNIKQLNCAVFESVPKAILHEVITEQEQNNWVLRTIMDGGLHPVLIFGRSEHQRNDEFHVEYAEGGLFSNRTKELSKLIESRSKDGWHVSGAFEDSFRMPCVVFRREQDKP